MINDNLRKKDKQIIDITTLLIVVFAILLGVLFK